MNNKSRIFGSLYGSLVGDALGVPVEFTSRAERQRDPVTGMRGQGTHGQPKGTWSDDGSLLLCTVESLAEKGFSTQDMAERFVQWYSRGLWSAHGTIFDIGIATRAALNRVENGTPAEEAGGRDQYDNGNGSLMRILPVVLASLQLGDSDFADRLCRSSAITHGHERSQLACVFFGCMVSELMAGITPRDALTNARGRFTSLFSQSPEMRSFHDLMAAPLHSWPEVHVRSGGYVIDTLTASIWCLLTSDSFPECVLKAVNLGDDTDTTGCVAGGLAGARYGIEAIPGEWLEALPRKAQLSELFAKFMRRLFPEGQSSTRNPSRDAQG